MVFNETTKLFFGLRSKTCQRHLETWAANVWELTQKPELNLNGQRHITTSMHRRISHVVLYGVKRSLLERIADYWGILARQYDTNIRFFKLVEALLQNYSWFFSYSIKLRGLPPSAVIVLLHYLQDNCVQQSHAAKHYRTLKNP